MSLRLDTDLSCPYRSLVDFPADMTCIICMVYIDEHPDGKHSGSLQILIRWSPTVKRPRSSYFRYDRCGADFQALHYSPYIS